MAGPDGIRTTLRLSDAQRLDWLRLIRSQNVGPRTFRTLVNHYGGARAALAALPGLAGRGGARRDLKVCAEDEALREMDAARRCGVVFIALGEAHYPPRLHEIDDAPPLLAVRGNAACLARPMVGMVGSRNASGAGIKFAELLARQLADNDFVVVSGLARGIDAAAHRASAEGGTVAVLAGGHDRVYPAEHVPLLERLIERGAAISEMPMGWEPRARDFPRRNRIISGVSIGIVVIEAAKRSGSLITARMAGEQGREVFAVPGSPLDPRAEGTNGLIKQGAALVTGIDDILDVLAPIIGRPASASSQEPTASEPLGEPDTSDRSAVIKLLGPSPVSIDDLIRLSGRSPAAVRMVLLELELAGRLERLGGAMVAING